MTLGRSNSRNRITKETREQILNAYLCDPIKGTVMPRISYCCDRLGEPSLTPDG
jgi:hypothetical protein